MKISDYKIKAAKEIAKSLGISLCAFGRNNICFYLPKEETVLIELKIKIEQIGLKFIEDDEDIEAGLITFADNTYVNMTNPYIGKSHFKIYNNRIQYILTFLVLVSLLLAASYIILFDRSEIKITGIVFLYFSLFLSYIELKRLTSEFILLPDSILYKTIFGKTLIFINDIKSISSGESFKMQEKIIIQLNNGKVIKTAAVFSGFAIQAKKALQLHLKQVS